MKSFVIPVALSRKTSRSLKTCLLKRVFTFSWRMVASLLKARRGVLEGSTRRIAYLGYLLLGVNNKRDKARISYVR
jgi:hypothetical protein